jgi:hypothetical protein
MFIGVGSLILSSLRQERNVDSSEHCTPKGVLAPQQPRSYINMSLLRSDRSRASMFLSPRIK